MPPPATREEFLRTPIGELAGYWLQIVCSCRNRTAIPLLWLATQRSPRMTVAQVLPKLLCRFCGARAASVRAVDRGDAGAFGGVPLGWHLDLLATDTEGDR